MIFLLLSLLTAGIFPGMTGVLTELIIFFSTLGLGSYSGSPGDEATSTGVVVSAFLFTPRFTVCNVPQVFHINWQSNYYSCIMHRLELILFTKTVLTTIPSLHMDYKCLPWWVEQEEQHCDPSCLQCWMYYWL